MNWANEHKSFMEIDQLCFCGFAAFFTFQTSVYKQIKVIFISENLITKFFGYKMTIVYSQ